MRLEFCNKKERRNCQHLIKALKEIEKHHLKDQDRPVYLTLTAQDLRLAPTLTDLHTQRLSTSCLVVLKGDIFTADCEEGDEKRVFLIRSFKMLRAFKKN
jgi:hypothetical protein